MTVRDVLVYCIGLFLIIGIFISLPILYFWPSGANDLGFDIDYKRTIILSLGVFLGVVVSQIYDRYTKGRKIRALRSDFLLGCLASTIMTVFLFEKVMSINSADLIFIFAFQNGFIFTTVIEKFTAAKTAAVP